MVISRKQLEPQRQTIFFRKDLCEGYLGKSEQGEARRASGEDEGRSFQNLPSRQFSPTTLIQNVARDELQLPCNFHRNRRCPRYFNIDFSDQADSDPRISNRLRDRIRTPACRNATLSIVFSKITFGRVLSEYSTLHQSHPADHISRFCRSECSNTRRKGCGSCSKYGLMLLKREVPFVWRSQSHGAGMCSSIPKGHPYTRKKCEQAKQHVSPQAEGRSFHEGEGQQRHSCQTVPISKAASAALSAVDSAAESESEWGFEKVPITSCCVPEPEVPFFFR